MRKERVRNNFSILRRSFNRKPQACAFGTNLDLTVPMDFRTQTPPDAHASGLRLNEELISDTFLSTRPTNKGLEFTNGVAGVER